MPGYKIESRGMARISRPRGAAASPKRLQNVALGAQPVWAQNPDSHPSKVYTSHNESSAT